MRRTFLFLLCAFAIVSCNRATTTTFSTLFSDDFQRADGALASSDWDVDAAGGGAATIDTGRAYATQGGSYSTRVVHPITATTTNLRVSADITVDGGVVSTPIVLLQLRKATGVASAVADSSYGCGFFGTDSLKIKRDGVDAATGVVPFPFADQDAYAMTFTQSGTTITCAVTGSASETLSFTDSSVLTGTFQGFISGVTGENFIFIDNFVISGF